MNAINKKIDYLNKVRRKMEALRNAMYAMNEIWLQDNDNHVDLNTFLSKEYPFEESFDDMVLLIKKWNERVQPLLTDEVMILQGFDENMIRARRNEVSNKSENITKSYTEVGGGGELFDMIRLKNGQVVCIGNGLIGIYANENDYETGKNDPQALVPLNKDNASKSL
jgi:hypothetical protein